jgi:NADPH:quinone reductase-like Zn-dependent oxidoreductase
MKAIVLHEYGGTDQLKYESTPDPIAKPGEILVKVAAAGINPIDWKLRSGAAKNRMPLEFPTILGRDVAGTVESVGSCASTFKKGDRVMGLVMGSYAELVAASESTFAVIPQGMTFETAASLPLVMLTGEQLISEAAKAEKGQTVLITGALGAVGRSAVHTALKIGCTVIAGVRSEQKEEAMSLGVKDSIALDDQADVKRLSPYDVVADTVGNAVGKMLLMHVRQGGVYSSTLGNPENAGNYSEIRFAPMMTHPDGKTLERMAQEVNAGEFTIPVSDKVPLTQAAKAQGNMEKGVTGKTVLLVTNNA